MKKFFKTDCWSHVEIPEKLANASMWEDISWHNDENPSLLFDNPKRKDGYVMWVIPVIDKEDPCAEHAFTLIYLPNKEDHGSLEDVGLYAGDDLDEALKEMTKYQTSILIKENK